MKIILASNNIPSCILNLIDEADIMQDNLCNFITTIDLYIESENPEFLNVRKI